MIKKRYKYLPVLVVLLLCMSVKTQDKQLAFPGAEGFGAYAVGGRGGDVYIVTNLNDKGSGSFREAVEATGPRNVVFAVSGTIELQSPLRIYHDSITIAGQTAPGNGICIKNYPLVIYECNHVIVRYIHSRLGIDKRYEHDALTGRFSNNVIIDHCSFSWSVDETVGPYDVSDYTLQWCIISESLHQSIHSQGPHGMGAFIGGKGFSFHHNLLAHHFSRMPRLCGSRYSGEPDLELVDNRNNVIYNWKTNSCYGGEGGSYNIVNNYYKSGPATESSIRNRIVAPRKDNGSEGIQEAGIWGRFYVSGNYVEGYPEITANNWNGGVQEVTEEEITLIKATTPFDVAEINTQSAEDAYFDILEHAGAAYPKRDAVDSRIIEDTRSGVATYGDKGIINSPADVGGYPELISTTPPADTDNDGMPDEWEDANSLDKNDPDDGKIIQSDGYSNLEHYINGLVEGFIPLQRPLNFKVSSISDKIVNLEWTDIPDEEHYILERAEGEGNYIQLAELDAGVTGYTDETITNYGEYSYRIKSINSTQESCFSTVQIEVTDPTPQTYRLSLNTEGSGNIIVSPSDTTYEEGTEVKITAEPADNWTFFCWTGDLSSTENPATLTMNSDKEVTANFYTTSGSARSELHNDGINVIPVPSDDRMIISFYLSEGEFIKTLLYNSQGKLIRYISQDIYTPGNNQIHFNCSDIDTGVYFLSLESKSITAKRLVIIK